MRVCRAIAPGFFFCGARGPAFRPPFRTPKPGPHAPRIWRQHPMRRDNARDCFPTVLRGLEGLGIGTHDARIACIAGACSATMRGARHHVAKGRGLHPTQSPPRARLLAPPPPPPFAGVFTGLEGRADSAPRRVKTRAARG